MGWKRLLTNNPPDSPAKNLQYVAVDNVNNGDTRAVINKVFGGFSNIPQGQPGLKFTAHGETKDNFHALLGTPNVYSTAWLLINHKEFFGTREITGITVFDDYGGVNLWVEIGDAQPLDSGNVDEPTQPGSADRDTQLFRARI